MKILLTGASGFIGLNLAERLLDTGHELNLLLRTDAQKKISSRVARACKVKIYDGTLASVEAAFADGVDVVIHVASYFVAEHKSAEIDALVLSNVLLGTQILEAMHIHGTRKLINFGTSWQHYESAPYNPVCLYAATKQAFEDIVRYYVEARSFKVIHLKLFDTYGPGDERPKLIKTLMRIALSGESLQMSPGEQLVDLVHISDVLSAVELALDAVNKADFEGAESYAVTQGVRITLKNLVGLLSKICGRNINVEWGARPYRQREVFEPWKTGHTMPGWKPVISLEAGLRELWESHV